MDQPAEHPVITVTDNRTANRFEARDGETLAGFAATLRTAGSTGVARTTAT